VVFKLVPGNDRMRLGDIRRRNEATAHWQQGVGVSVNAIVGNQHERVRDAGVDLLLTALVYAQGWRFAREPFSCNREG
jgi:hypothetical protein